MRQAKTEDELAALAQWVVVRTASGQIRERLREGNCWLGIGSERPVDWKGQDFPVQVLWSYADEVAPPYPPSTPGGGTIPGIISPYTISAGQEKR